MSKNNDYIYFGGVDLIIIMICKCYIGADIYMFTKSYKNRKNK